MKFPLNRLAAALALAIGLASCGGSSDAPAPTVAPQGVRVFDRSTAPAQLSQWNFLKSDGSVLSLNQGVVPYDLSSALFSDYAHKFRAVYVPEGKKVTYDAERPFDFPVGSVVMKTFYYPRAQATEAGAIGAARSAQFAQGETVDLTRNRLIETRVFVRQPDGSWAGLPYVWSDDQKDATLRVAGELKRVQLVAQDGSREAFTYAVPTAQDCVQCHGTESSGGGSSLLIGPKARYLNKDYAYAAGRKNQLTRWSELGWLAGLPPAASLPVALDWADTSLSPGQRAKAYLDINCAHCHTAKGQALQSGLLLNFSIVDNPAVSGQWGVCKKPLAYAGPGGAYQVDIAPGRPDASILLYRLSHTDTQSVMPVIGRHVNHTEGNALVAGWILGLKLPPCD